MSILIREDQIFTERNGIQKESCMVHTPGKEILCEIYRTVTFGYLFDARVVDIE